MDIERDRIHARTRILRNRNTHTSGSRILSELLNVTSALCARFPLLNPPQRV